MDPPIHNRIRLPDSAIQKSIIYAKFASRTPPHLKKKMIKFWIDESIAHFQISISGNHDALFQIKGQGQFRDLENYGVPEEKSRGAGRRILLFLALYIFLLPLLLLLLILSLLLFLMLLLILFINFIINIIINIINFKNV